eukprot:6207381-Heterocapsa_arctica.AAC.1
MFLGQADVRDCSHRMRTPPPWLHAYFALPQVPACVVGLGGSTLDGRVLQHDDGVYPCWAVLPMGFTWSLYNAQRANERLASAGIPARVPLFHDRGPPLVMKANASKQRAFYG